MKFKVERPLKSKKPKKRLSGKSCRTKGHQFERWVAGQFQTVYPEAKRHLEYQKEEALGIDLENTGNYRVQCKRGRRYANPSALMEVQIDAIEGGVPVLITQGDHVAPVACLPFSEFLRLIGAERKARKG